MFELMVVLMGGAVVLPALGIALKLILALVHIALLPLKFMVSGVAALLATSFAISVFPFALIVMVLLLGAALAGIVLIARP